MPPANSQDGAPAIGAPLEQAKFNPTIIIAGGLTVAVIVGELALSIGFAVSFEGVLVTGSMVKQGLPVRLAILGRSGVWLAGWADRRVTKIGVTGGHPRIAPR